MTFTVADLFSGSGGMSYGFHANPLFKIIGAIDAQIGKPSSNSGTLDCNKTYFANIGLQPHERNLHSVEGSELIELFSDDLDVLLACPPCTGFSRANPKNHLKDDQRNSLVQRVGLWVSALMPKILIMENARELISGNFSEHYQALNKELTSLGYQVYGGVHFLNTYGLPQKRERALIIATRVGRLQTLEDLWSGYVIDKTATTVRSAIGSLPRVVDNVAHEADSLHVSPALKKASTRRRLQLIPKNGGSWIDLRFLPEADEVLTPSMKRSIAQGRLGSHPDVYGRLWWDKPSVTIKRECAHVGNGRYSHPEQDRMLTVREMSILQGFPNDYKFVSNSLAKKYRHIGDAVPPLISHQLSWIALWILSGQRPSIEKILLPKTHLHPRHIHETGFIPEQGEFCFS